MNELEPIDPMPKRLRAIRFSAQLVGMMLVRGNEIHVRIGDDGMPPTATVVGIQTDRDNQRILEILVADDSFDEVPEDKPIPRVSVTIHDLWAVMKDVLP